MNNYKSMHRKGVKIIATVVACLFLINNIAGAYPPDNSSSVPPDTLSRWLVTQALMDESIFDPQEVLLEAEMSIRLLHKNPEWSERIINAYLIEAAERDGSKEKIQFREITRADRVTKAKFEVLRNNRVLEIAYENGVIKYPVPQEKAQNGRTDKKQEVQKLTPDRNAIQQKNDNSNQQQEKGASEAGRRKAGTADTSNKKRVIGATMAIGFILLSNWWLWFLNHTLGNIKQHNFFTKLLSHYGLDYFTPIVIISIFLLITISFNHMAKIIKKMNMRIEKILVVTTLSVCLYSSGLNFISHIIVLSFPFLIMFSLKKHKNLYIAILLSSLFTFIPGSPFSGGQLFCSVSSVLYALLISFLIYKCSSIELRQGNTKFNKFKTYFFPASLFFVSWNYVYFFFIDIFLHEVPPAALMLLHININWLLNGFSSAAIIASFYILGDVLARRVFKRKSIEDMIYNMPMSAILTVSLIFFGYFEGVEPLVLSAPMRGGTFDWWDGVASFFGFVSAALLFGPILNWFENVVNKIKSRQNKNGNNNQFPITDIGSVGDSQETINQDAETRNQEQLPLEGDKGKSVAIDKEDTVSGSDAIGKFEKKKPNKVSDKKSEESEHINVLGLSPQEERQLYVENKDEEFLLARAERHLENYFVNMYIDLDAVPQEGLTEIEQKEQLDKNIETLARMITVHSMFNMNIRYILENDTDYKAFYALMAKLERLAKFPGVDREKLLSSLEKPYSGDNVIEIMLKTDENIGKMQEKVNDWEFVICLADNPEKLGVPIPNYTAAATVGLAQMALRVAAGKAKGEDMMKKFDAIEHGYKKNMFSKIKRIYERYGVTKNKKFIMEDLKFMVAGCSRNKIDYAKAFALPPIAKDLVERINEVHEIMHRILQSA